MTQQKGVGKVFSSVRSTAVAMAASSIVFTCAIAEGAQASEMLCLPDLDPSFLPGDANGDDRVDITDMITIFNHLFNEGTELVAAAAEVNGDLKVDISDAMYLSNYLFGGGPPPVTGTERVNPCDRSPGVDIYDNVRLIENDACFDYADRTDSSRVVAYFSCDPKTVLQVGDVVLGATDGGYLGEIVQVQRSGNAIALALAPTTLDRVFHSGTVDMNNIVFELVDPILLAQTYNLPPQTNNKGSKHTKTFDWNTVLYAEDGVEVTTSGELDLEATFNGNMEFDWFSLESAEVDLDIRADLTARLIASFSDDVKVDLPDISFLTRRFYLMVIVPTPYGPVPVPATLSINLSVGGSLGAGGSCSWTIEDSAHTRISAGMSYTADEPVTSYGDANFSTGGGERRSNCLVSTEASTHLSITGAIEFYGVTGGELSIEPGLTYSSGVQFFSGSSDEEYFIRSWKLTGDVAAEAGLHLNVFSKELEADFGPWKTDSKVLASDRQVYN